MLRSLPASELAANLLPQTINHAGYTRSIIARNPVRYNEYGDELEDEDSDPEADNDAQEENPYSGVRIEGRLLSASKCDLPLIHDYRTSRPLETSLRIGHSPYAVRSFPRLGPARHCQIY